MKKVISLCLCIAMLVSCLSGLTITAFAEDVSWSESFTGYTGIDTIPADFSTNDEEGMEQYGSSGLFGKASDDTAFTMEIDPEGDEAPGGFAECLQWNPENALGRKTFNEGEFLVFGFEFAIDSYIGKRDIMLDSYNETSTRKAMNDFFVLHNNANGKVTVLGQTVTSSMPLNTWVNFDFVIDPNKCVVDVYYNGNEVVRGYDFSSNIGENISKIDSARMRFYPQKIDGTYVNTHTYVDNYYAKIVSAEPVIAPVTISSNNEKVVVSADRKEISAESTLTVDQVVSSLVVPTGATVTVEDANKAVQSGNIQAGYLRVKTTDNKYAYYTVSTYSTSSLTYNNFDSALGVEVTNGKQIGGLNYAGSEGDYAKGVTVDGDNALMLYSGAGKTTSARRVNMTAADIGDCFAIAFDFKTTSNTGRGAMTLRYANTSGNEWNYNDIIDLQESGAIRFNYTNVGTYEVNQWHQVTIFADKTSKLAKVYIDGEFKVETLWSPLNSFDRIIEAILVCGGSASKDKVIYYDNFCIMPVGGLNSVDTASMAIMPTNITNKNIVDGNVISGYGAMTVADLKNVITKPEKATVTVYNGTTACADTDVLADGMLVKVLAEDGRHKKVFYLDESMRKESAITVGGKKVEQLYAGEAKGVFTGYVETETPVALVIEHYKNDEIVQSKTNETTVSGAFSVDVALDAALVDEPGNTVKFYVYDNTTDKNEIAPAKEITYSETLELSTEILKVYGGRDAIYSITMDDGYTQSLTKFFKPWFDNYDLVGSSLAICTWMTPEYLAVAQPMIAKGQMDIMSHSYTHPGTVAELEASAYNEVYGSRRKLRELYPGADVLSYGPGSGVMSDNVFPMVKEAYYASRAGTRGYNELDMSGNDWYDVKVQGVLGGSGDTWKSSANGYDGETAASMNAWLDNAVANNKWLVEMWHSVCWPESEGLTTMVSDGGYRPIPGDIGEEHVAYASQLQSEGKLWVAKFDDALKYIYERNHATVNDIATRTDRNITLTHSLDKATFNHPLTLKSDVPADWDIVKITQGDIVTYKTVENDANGSYVIYDAIANYAGITLEEVLEAGEDVAVDSLTISTPENLVQNVIEGTAFEPVEFSITSDVSGIDTNKIVWYKDGEQVATGTSYAYTPEDAGEVVICARYAGTYTPNRYVYTSITAIPKGPAITNLKYLGTTVTVAENTQTFDDNKALKFMWGDMLNEKMSFQHGWFTAIGGLSDVHKDAKYMTTGADFNTDGTGNYLEFDVDRDVIIVGMYEGWADQTNLMNYDWSVYGKNDELYKTYAYLRGTSAFSYMFYKEFEAGKVEIPYAGSGHQWAHGGGFAIIEKVSGEDPEPEVTPTPTPTPTPDPGVTPLPNYNLFSDDFDDQAVNSKVAANKKWDYADNRDMMAMIVKVDPTDSSNKVAYIWNDATSTKYPYMRKSISTDKPFVISGKALLERSIYASSVLAIGGFCSNGVGYITGDMNTFLKFYNTADAGKIGINGGWIDNAPNVISNDVTWQDGEWLRYEILVEPHATDAKQSRVTAVVSGVRDADNNLTTIKLTDTIDLTKTNYLTNGKMDVLVAATMVKGNANDFYVDDIKIYQQQRDKQEIILNKTTDVEAEGDTVKATLIFDLDATTVAADKINVSDGTSTVHPSSIVYNAMTPNVIEMTFDEGVLEAGKEYTVSFDSSVKDLFGTTEAATATFTTKAAPVPETPSAKLTISVEGDGNVTDADGNVASFENKAFDLNTAFELTATALEGYEFAYWVDMNSDRVISDEATYNFTLVSDKKIKAVFTDVSENAKTVIFRNKNGQIVSRVSVSEGEITVPADPVYMGYNFAGWKLGGQLTSLKAGDKVKYEDLASGENVYDAYYEKGTDKYKLMLTNGIASPAEEEYAYDSKITVTGAAPTEGGSVFSHWLKDNVTVSYDESYSFFMGAADTELEAIYVEAEADKEAKAPVIVMINPVVLSGQNRIAFFAERNLYADEENGRELVETGIIVDATGTKNDFGFDDGILKATSTSKAGSGQFTVRKASLDAGDVVRARAYLIYREGGEIKTVFSNIVEGTYN